MFKRLLFLSLILFFTACSVTETEPVATTDTPAATAVSTTIPPTPIVAVEPTATMLSTAVSTPPPSLPTSQSPVTLGPPQSLGRGQIQDGVFTAVPTSTRTSTPTSKPTSTATATWLPVQTPMATADPAKVPQMVWLQYHDGSYTDPPTVLAVRSGVAAYEEFPMEITSFWDYSPVSGRAAFSNSPRHASPYGDKSVTDLWVYNYETGQAEMWFTDNVGSAGWSSTIHPQTGTELLAVAVFKYQYDLLILSSPESVVATIPNASPQFSWSADGQWIAFFGWRDQKHGIYIVPATGGAATYVTHLHWVGSILDRPLWAQEHQAIFDSSSPRLLFIDSTVAVGVPESRSPYNMLWDPKTRQLLMGFEADWGSREEIRVFEFSEDLRTITKDYAIGGIMADWLVPGEKLLLADGQIIDWPITDQ